MVKIIWNASKFKGDLNKHINMKMKRIVVFLEGQVKQLISKGNLTGSTPSKPGEPPRVRTGTLRANISHDVSQGPRGIIGRVGVRTGPADRYAPLLEKKGIRDGSTRPFLRPTLLKNRVTIIRMLS